LRLVHVSTVMAALSLCAAVVLYVRVEHLERDMGASRAEPRDARTLGVADGEAARAYPLPAPAAAGGTGTGGESRPAATAAAPGAGSGERAPSLEERVMRLEESQKAMQVRERPWRQIERTFARDVDDLARKLSLTPTQKVQMEDVVTRGRQRIEDVLKIPDETGKSPYERRVEARKRLADAMHGSEPGGVLAFATDMVSYRNRKIPGRNDTYGAEIDRIRKETREEMGRVLDAKQQEDFDQMNVDGLLGEGGQVSIAYAVGDVGAAIEVEEQVEDGSEGEPAPRGAGLNR